MTVFVAFVRSLLADPRSVRAFDEATLDWRTEAAETTSAFGRVLIHLRGRLSIARVFASWSCPREVTGTIRRPHGGDRLLGAAAGRWWRRSVNVLAAGQPEIRQLGRTSCRCCCSGDAAGTACCLWACSGQDRGRRANRPQPWAALAVCTVAVSLACGLDRTVCEPGLESQAFAAMSHIPLAEARQLGQGLSKRH